MRTRGTTGGDGIDSISRTGIPDDTGGRVVLGGRLLDGEMSTDGRNRGYVQYFGLFRRFMKEKMVVGSLDQIGHYTRF